MTPSLALERGTREMSEIGTPGQDDELRIRAVTNVGDGWIAGPVAVMLADAASTRTAAT